jgi:hypothetical protein
MRYLKITAFVLFSVGSMALSGCGSSNSSSATNDPFAGSSGNSGTDPRAGTIASSVGGVIMFTSAAGTTPGGQTNLLTPWKAEVDLPAGMVVEFCQLIPFKVTDADGNPRVGVPVALSVYSTTSQNPNDVTIDFLVSSTAERTPQTITTDSAGQGIFNVTVAMQSPGPGGVNTVDVVFKAVTYDDLPVTAYVGNSYTLTGKTATPTTPVAPATTP